MNKTEYLEWLRKWGACEEGLMWVEARPEESAKGILLACDRVDWLVWNIGRMNPTKIVEFAKRCSDRADAEAAASARTAWAAEVAARAAESAADAAVAAAVADAADAAEWAEAAANAAARASGTAERRAQLEDLHQLVKEVF